AFVTKDTTRISWGGMSWCRSFKELEYDELDQSLINASVYRPFTKIWHYASRKHNHSFYSFGKIKPNSACENLSIMLKPNRAAEGCIALITDCTADLQSDGGIQCF